MSSVLITPVDPASASFDADLQRWYDVYLAVTLDGRPGDAAPWPLPEVRDFVSTPTGFRWCGAWLATREGEAVGAGLLDLPLSSNRTMANVSVLVLPAARRTGVGSALLEVLEREAAARGRTLVLGEVEFGIDVPDEGAAEPGLLFARSHGYAVGQADFQRRLDLPVDAALLDRLAAEAAPHHAAYELVSWRGPVPDDLAARYAALASQLLVEAPTGDLEIEGEDPSVAALREREAARVRQGTSVWHTVALTAEGELVAHTVVAVSEHNRELCEQWGTLVRSDHRGHRLGLAVKVANHRALQADGPPAKQIATWNATVNDHMAAINEQLGFHRVGRLVEVQKQI
ncbi:GNAT family N-acetyltransferase [Nocardioides phosphati]|uniref:GNAT family N-acetyltransferase n=1 Tax=Nocardioides phosphati TaxID=1867775 RepID=A0ABQ2NBB4_9ACTN|nr:GNAT family N-acetyltransferase [Nocardioides phosphati]GGO90050.1 GNAT family N-acetyltransferase [Nocardioides phosphati]